MPSLGHITRCRGEVREVLLSVLYAQFFILSSVIVCYIMSCRYFLKIYSCFPTNVSPHNFNIPAWHCLGKHRICPCKSSLPGRSPIPQRKRPGIAPRRFLLFCRNMFDQIAGLTTKHGTNPVDVVPTHQLTVSQLLDRAFSQQFFFSESVRVVSLLFKSCQNIDLVSDWHPITSS